MAAKKVIQAGDGHLKSKNKMVLNVKSVKTQKLIKNLVQSMKKAGLIGIAANQIGQNYRIFVTFPRFTKSRRIGKGDRLRVYINPKLTFKSKTKTLIYEGCGSVADGAIFGPVLRPGEVEIEASNEKGKKFRLRADGILARVIQHEMDHLEGVEFIQKVSDYSKIIVEDYYRKKVRNSKLQRLNSKITKIEYKTL